MCLIFHSFSMIDQLGLDLFFVVNTTSDYWVTFLYWNWYIMMLCKSSIYITITHIIIIAQIYYYLSLTICNSLPQPKSPPPGYLPHYFINSSGIANKKTWSQFFPLRVTPPSNITCCIKRTSPVAASVLM